MGVTPFDDELKKRSDIIHQTYRDSIYSRLFEVPKEAIHYDTIPSGLLELGDHNLALDGSVDVMFERMRYPMCFTVSWRFRDAEKYQKYKDMTITECNPDSGLRGELYKGAIDFFTYGYYSNSLCRLNEVIVVNFNAFKMAVARGLICPNRGVNPRTHQPFLGYKFADLKQIGVMVLHLVERNGILTPKEEVSS